MKTTYVLGIAYVNKVVKVTTHFLGYDFEPRSIRCESSNQKSRKDFRRLCKTYKHSTAAIHSPDESSFVDLVFETWFEEGRSQRD